MRALACIALLAIGPAPAAERLWHRLPDGFYPTNPVITERLVARTWVPAGEDDATWTRALSVQNMPGMARTAAELSARFEDAARRRCIDAGEFSVLERTDGDAPSVTTFHRCATSSGADAGVTRVLQGREGDHVISLDFDHPPTPAELERLMPFVREARVCDDADPARACPAGGVAPVHLRAVRTGVD